jgi:VanZ family protein
MIIRLLQRVNHPIFFRAISYFWLAITCYLLFKPGIGYNEPVFFIGEDKLAHFTLFFNLTFLWGLNFRQTLDLNRNFTFKVLIGFGVVFAALSEWIQEYIPYREMDLADFIFDLIGIIFGVVLFFFIEKRLNAL